MSTEDMLEGITMRVMKAYKRNSHNSPIGQRLNRHEPVVLDGVEMTYWREYTVYKMAEFVKDIDPTIGVEVFLEGNDSALQLEMDDAQQQNFNRKMYDIIKRLELDIA